MFTQLPLMVESVTWQGSADVLGAQKAMWASELQLHSNSATHQSCCPKQFFGFLCTSAFSSLKQNYHTYGLGLYAG